MQVVVINCIRSYLLRAVNVKIVAFWDIFLCSLAEGTNTAEEYFASVFKVAK
jgi:hypothetical protein